MSLLVHPAPRYPRPHLKHRVLVRAPAAAQSREAGLGFSAPRHQLGRPRRSPTLRWRLLGRGLRSSAAKAGLSAQGFSAPLVSACPNNASHPNNAAFPPCCTLACTIAHVLRYGHPLPNNAAFPPYSMLACIIAHVLRYGHPPPTYENASAAQCSCTALALRAPP